MIPLTEIKDAGEEKALRGGGDDAFACGYIELEVSLIHSFERNGGQGTLICKSDALLMLEAWEVNGNDIVLCRLRRSEGTFNILKAVRYSRSIVEWG